TIPLHTDRCRTTKEPTNAKEVRPDLRVCLTRLLSRCSVRFQSRSSFATSVAAAGGAAETTRHRSAATVDRDRRTEADDPDARRNAHRHGRLPAERYFQKVSGDLRPHALQL